MTFFPSAKVVIKDPLDKERIFLVKRTIRNGIFYEPAGGKVKIEPKLRRAETLEECAIREIREELGYTFTIDQYIGSSTFFGPLHLKIAVSVRYF